MRVVIYKHILRDLSTMKKVGYINVEAGVEPSTPPGTFVSKCVGSYVESRSDEIIEIV